MSKFHQGALKFGGAVFLQVLILLTLAWTPFMVEYKGEEVFIETVPVDPRHIFMGDYVDLRYTISELDLLNIDHDLDNWTGEHYGGSFPVYVVVAKKGIAHEAIGVYREKPVIAPEQVLLRGKISSFTYIPQWIVDEEKEMNIQPIHRIGIDYGLEHFYVPEGTGIYYEDLIRNNQQVYGIAKVYQGRSVLVDLYVKKE
ncbi:GDYXXLXY domain-containing protein [Heliorestis acidaminivorans]|uniref:GDYXXLXY domain-containing protein n=1 Tax=Heliorestis acidaminivorans TaxID=553427 RepID=UPI0014788560|nr:GDYXXLXY domain-containing protein [Heliorestis acidaminivorans]